MFDEVVQLAAQICGTTISVVNLIDAERQWFKAEVGLGVRETPLGTSICSHVILAEDFTEIPDTMLDRRMQDNPLCNGESALRFYAGALLRSDEGLPIGTLCVLDHAPRRLTPLQRDALRILADQVMNQLNLRRALRHAAALRIEVDHRVKNSLQAIASLTRMQARQAEGDETRAALDEVQRRIDTVAALHEHLYKTEVTSRVDLGAYVRAVADLIAESAPKGVRIETQAETLMATSQQASTVGIVLNELATNAFKHAFPNGRGGTVRFDLRRIGDDVELGCADDGSGMAENGGHDGRGGGLVQAMAQQIGGTMETETGEGGTVVWVRFPVA